MKVAVTTIMKDETPEFIERWAKSAIDADELVLTDTGSSNDAVTCARDLGVTVHEIDVKPLRFDVARNAGLALISPDIDTVLTVDVDEVLTAGWRDHLDNAPEARRYSYDYVWNWTVGGEPNIAFRGDRCHSRFGWMWRHPIHEALYATEPDPGPTVPLDFRIEHHADNTKPRSQYLPLLRVAVQEDPNNDRMAHYYARELFFIGDWAAARAEFVRHLALPSATWAAERAQSLRYLAKMDDYPEKWLLRAAAEDPDRREPLVDLVDLWWERGQPIIAAGFAMRALQVTQTSGDYLREADAWDDRRLVAIVQAAMWEAGQQQKQED